MGAEGRPGTGALPVRGRAAVDRLSHVRAALRHAVLDLQIRQPGEQAAAVGLGAWLSFGARSQTQGDALAHLLAADGPT
jgi:hypothetical protein